MSDCIKCCRLCDKLIISTAINYDSTNNQVIVALPANAYNNCQKYCIIFAQNIPASATINSQVVFTIGNNATRYPFVNCNCVPIYASQIRTRRVYSTRVNTAINNGVFKYIGKCPLPNNATTVNTSIPIKNAVATPVVENLKVTSK